MDFGVNLFQKLAEMRNFATAMSLRNVSIVLVRYCLPIIGRHLVACISDWRKQFSRTRSCKRRMFREIRRTKSIRNIKVGRAIWTQFNASLPFQSNSIFGTNKREQKKKKVAFCLGVKRKKSFRKNRVMLVESRKEPMRRFYCICPKESMRFSNFFISVPGCLVSERQRTAF